MNIKEIILNEHGAWNPNSPAGKEAIRLSQPATQTTADALRAGANELSYGHYDKGAAAVNSAINNTNYDTELRKEYRKSADAEKRSPIASEVGRAASYVAPFGAAAVGAKLAVKGATKLIPKTLDIATKTGKAISIGSKGGAGIGGAIAGDVAAKEIATQVDPNNPHLEEVKSLINFFKRDAQNLEGGAAGLGSSGARVTKLGNAAGQIPPPTTVVPGSLKPPTTPTTLAPGSLAPSKMSGGTGPASPASTGVLGPTPKHIANPNAPAPTPNEPGIVRRLATGAVKKVAKGAVNLGLTGAGLYLANKAIQQYGFTDPNKKAKDAASAENARLDALAKQNEPKQDTEQQPQQDIQQKPQTNEPTNEDSKELERLKHLTKYRS